MLKTIKQSRPHIKRGFTLVEVTVVVGIVSLLSSIAIPNLLRNKTIANETFAQTTLKTIAIALENYAAINSEYPTNKSQILDPNPPYLNKDLFSGVHQGYTYNETFASFSYSIVASPTMQSQGTKVYTVTTGAIITESNPP